MLFILIGVYITTRQKPVLRQERFIVLNKKRIKIYKIRTIKDGIRFRELEESSREIFEKKEYEEFITPFCSWLRRSGIDELPQLINVINGDMTLVGPRPLIRKDLEMLRGKEKGIYERRKEIKSKPGITGCWQIWGERNKGSNNLIYFDELYEKNKSILLDMKVLKETFFVVLAAKHSDSVVAVCSSRKDFVTKKKVIFAK